MHDAKVKKLFTSSTVIYLTIKKLLVMLKGRWNAIMRVYVDIRENYNNVVDKCTYKHTDNYWTSDPYFPTTSSINWLRFPKWPMFPTFLNFDFSVGQTYLAFLMNVLNFLDFTNVRHIKNKTHTYLKNLTTVSCQKINLNTSV